MDWKVPDFSTVSKRQKIPQVRNFSTDPASAMLDLLANSTGIKFVWKVK